MVSLYAQAHGWKRAKQSHSSTRDPKREYHVARGLILPTTWQKRESLHRQHPLRLRLLYSRSFPILPDLVHQKNLASQKTSAFNTMASSETQSALPQISPEQPTNGPYLVNQDDYVAALLSSIQTAAIANMNYLLATDTGRITAVRTIILGSTLHAMHGLPSAVAQVRMTASSKAGRY